jgi:hypothetical protein
MTDDFRRWLDDVLPALRGFFRGCEVEIHQDPWDNLNAVVRVWHPRDGRSLFVTTRTNGGWNGALAIVRGIVEARNARNDLDRATEAWKRARP